MTSLSPYHQELRQDLIDYELLQMGLQAFERISGVPAGEALFQLSGSATKEQCDRVVRRCERAEEFYKLPEELQAQLRDAA